MVNHVSECVYKLSYQPNCTRLKNLVLISLTKYILAILNNLNISSFKHFHLKKRFITKSDDRICLKHLWTGNTELRLSSYIANLCDNDDGDDNAKEGEASCVLLALLLTERHDSRTISYH